MSLFNIQYAIASPFRVKSFVCTNSQESREKRANRKQRGNGREDEGVTHMREIDRQRKKKRREVGWRIGGKIHPLFYIRLTHEC